MTTLYILPIEPLEERYTAEWYRNLPVRFSKYFKEVITIDGVQTTDGVDVGAFLDMNSTIYYKAAQMQKVSELFRKKQIKDGSTFFISDIEFWGIESLRLMSQLNGVKIKIYGFLHAASYTKEDAFEVAAPYQKYTELGWVAACDGIFVGSAYHADAFFERRIKPFAAADDIETLKNKFIVSGNPLFKEEYPDRGVEKKNKIIISNRFDFEKRPNESLTFAYLMKKRRPDVEVVITTSRATFRSNQQWLVDFARGMEQDGIVTIKAGLTKAQYHTELQESKIMLSNSIEENFGYCIAEALAYSTYPLLPNKLSHPELVDGYEPFLYNSYDEILDKMEYLLTECEVNTTSMLDNYYQAADTIGFYMRYTNA